MRGFIAAIFTFVSLMAVAHAQGMPNMAPPDEMKAVDFLKGQFEGVANFHFAGQTAPSPCTAVGERMLNDRYMHTVISYAMKMPDGSSMQIQGMHMLTYDPAAKQYVAWWFDGTAPTVMKMTGNFQGDKLVLLSEPTPVEPGGPAGIMRSTWWKTSDGVGFTLEMKNGDKWDSLMDGSFKKK